ncbi:MAG: hypothetical protein ACOZNI_12080 [Myxococcota bacterium]
MRTPRRTSPKDRGNSRVTAQDALLLRFVGEAAPTTARAVAHYLGRTLDRVYHRARVLHAHGLLARTVHHVNEPDRLTLTSEGRQFVAQKFGLDPDILPTVRVKGGDYVHHDMTVDAYATLARATARSNLWSLTRFRFEREIRRAIGAPSGALVPDGLATLAHADGRTAALVFEADTGSTDPRWVARHKFLPYAQAALARQPFFDVRRWRVCVLVPNERRLAHLAIAAWRAGVPVGLVYFGLSGSLDEAHVLRDGWTTFEGVDGTEDFCLVTRSALPGPRTKPQDGVGGLAEKSGRSTGVAPGGRAGRSGTEDGA